MSVFKLLASGGVLTRIHSYNWLVPARCPQSHGALTCPLVMIKEQTTKDMVRAARTGIKTIWSWDMKLDSIKVSGLGLPMACVPRTVRSQDCCTIWNPQFIVPDAVKWYPYLPLIVGNIVNWFPYIPSIEEHRLEATSKDSILMSGLSFDRLSQNVNIEDDKYQILATFNIACHLQYCTTLYTMTDIWHCAR